MYELEPNSLTHTQEWTKQYPQYLSLPPAGPSFYANVYHPAFNVDADEANETIDKFVTHTKAVGRGVQGLRNVYGSIRQAGIGQSNILFSMSIP